MRRVLFLSLVAVSCATPEHPSIDGVPEDPGHVPMLPEAPVHPSPLPTTTAPSVTPPDNGGSTPDQTDPGPIGADAGLEPSTPATDESGATGGSGATGAATDGDNGDRTDDATDTPAGGHADASATAGEQNGDAAPPPGDAGIADAAADGGRDDDELDTRGDDGGNSDAARPDAGGDQQGGR